MARIMTTDERERFLAEERVGVLSVTAEYGRAPLAVPIWYLYEPGGEIRFITGGQSRKMRLVRAAGRVTVTVQEERPPYRYVTVEGDVTGYEEPADPADRQAVARRYLGEDGAAAYLASTEHLADAAVLVRVRPQRWLSRAV
ncbi:pyridoxamine 5'-phosphate oxidase family protein [Actinomadura gamaensis]|uniref:Pyridoxamine 5'-phosphate oxidase family protein n=1 Tax=Actinomadura gamaensis TaxID=1763541 RepID=A0ABV9U5R4_9ACTN